MTKQTMTIRKTTMADLTAVMDIYAQARAFMRENGNPGQWKTSHPAREIIENDISGGLSYVCTTGGTEKPEKILAVFFFTTEPEPTYEKIDGAWLDDSGTYGVIHRIARAAADKEAKGAGEFCISWCFEQIPNIKIDTHPDNAPMLRLMEKLGFVQCGTIWLENGEERVAFQKLGVCTC